MTDNPNIIKEALEAAKAFTNVKDFWGGDKHRAKAATDKINAALALIEKSEVRFGGTLEGAVPLFVTPTKDFKLRYLVIPLEQEQSE